MHQSCLHPRSLRSVASLLTAAVVIGFCCAPSLAQETNPVQVAAPAQESGVASQAISAVPQLEFDIPTISLKGSDARAQLLVRCKSSSSTSSAIEDLTRSVRFTPARFLYRQLLMDMLPLLSKFRLSLRAKMNW